MRAFVADFMEEYNSANDDGAPRGMSGMGRGVTSVVAAGGRSLTAASIEPRSTSPSLSSSAGGGVGGSLPLSRALSGGGRLSSDATTGGGTRLVYLWRMFLVSLLGGWAHFSILLFFMHGQMQYATTRSRSLNSRWIVSLEGMPCLSYILLLDGRSTVHLRLLRLQRTRDLSISCLRLHIHVMRERQRR